MSLNHPFVVKLVSSYRPPPGRLLDFGCGKADVTALALDHGYDAYGVDTFLGVGDSSANLELAAARIGDRVIAVQPDKLMPFKNSFFDVVIANQVFEHVLDLDNVCSELARIIRPGGILLTLMPTAEILWEDHLKMPLVHRFPAGSWQQCQMMRAFRRLGFGTSRHVSDDEWVNGAIADLQQNVFYRSVSEYISAFSKDFQIFAEEEPAWAHYRIRHHRLLKRWRRLLEQSAFNGPVRYAVRRAAGAVLLFQRMSVT